MEIKLRNVPTTTLAVVPLSARDKATLMRFKEIITTTLDKVVEIGIRNGDADRANAMANANRRDLDALMDNLFNEQWGNFEITDYTSSHTDVDMVYVVVPKGKTLMEVGTTDAYYNVDDARAIASKTGGKVHAVRMKDKVDTTNLS